MRILIGMLAVIIGGARQAQADGGRVTEPFDRDPAWESFRSHLTPDKPHLVRQHFGWRDTQLARGEKAGEIGGWVQRSITPASYAKKIDRRTFDDALTASGTFAVTKGGGASGALVGWFNEKSKGWRTPNSLACRIDGNGNNYWVLFEYGTRNWRTGGMGTFDGAYQTTKTKPFAADGTPHRWTLAYDPRGADGNGLATFILDGKTYDLPLTPGHKADGAEFDRFGIFNQQTTGNGLELYVDDLTLDGQAQDFSRDPGWEGRGNDVEREEKTIRPFHDFGYQPTANAGGVKGEIGGIIWRDERPAYYADKVGPFTLDDELYAAGRLAFTGAGSDGGAAIGFFDSTTKRAKAIPEHKEKQPNVIGIHIEGPSRIGHYFVPFYRDRAGGAGAKEQGPIIRPDGKPHEWSLHYSPTAAAGNGQVTLELDGESQTLDLKPEHRKRGATFDRFGFFNVQSGGHYVFLYVDDLTYTKARATK